MSPVDLQFGIVQAFEKGRARVQFPDRENVVSPWLTVGYRRTKDDQEYDPLAIGEPVACLMRDDGTSGVVLCSTYTEDCPVPTDAEQLWTRRFKDGTKIDYDRTAKKLTVHCEGDVEVTTVGDTAITAQGDVNLTAAGDVNVTAEGEAKVQAPQATVTAASNAKVNAPTIDVDASFMLKLNGPLVTIGGLGMPAARLGDMVLGGVIFKGSSKVLIGG